MRADAVRNRARIIEAARAALDAGQTPPMSVVAAEAAVGQGTLYRHFPTWAELVMAVHREDVTGLIEMAPRLLDRHPPIRALQLWLQRLAEYGRIKHGLSGALHTDLATEGQAPIVAAIQLFLDAGAADGTIRTDIGGHDLLLLVGFLWRLDLTPERDDRAARLLDVVLHGLQPVLAGASQPGGQKS